MKTLRLISFMVLGYSVVALYLALVYWEEIHEGMIPVGWYEASDYGESTEISDTVIGWQNLPDPWE